MLWEPVHNIAVVGGNAELMPFSVADDVLLRQPVLLAEIDAQLDRFLVNGRKICGVGKLVLAYLKANVCVVGAAASVPAANIPRKRLVGGNAAVFQLAYKGMA